ncbi:MAG: hemolysin family protein [Bacteroidota bacterium]
MAWLILFLTLCLSFYFSGMEIAFYSSSRLKIELRAAQGGWAATMLSRFIRQWESEAIITILIGNNFALVIFTMMLEQLLTPLMDETLGLGGQTFFLLKTFLQTIIGTLIVLVLAEYIPKAIFRSNSDRIVFPATYLLTFFFVLLWPIVKIVEGFRSLLHKAFFRSSNENDSDDLTLGKKDLDHYLHELINTPDTDTIPDLDTEMLNNALAFRETKARECMIPRTEIEAVPIDANIDELMDKFIETQLSRIIIYGENLDEVKGYVHSSSLFSKPENWQDLIQQVTVVPEAMPANKLMLELTENQRSVGLVVDEFGGTAGILTIEDLIEEVFGEIEDEYYEEELEEDLVKVSYEDGSFLLGARHEIDDLNEELSLELPMEEYYTTLGGLITYVAESIPPKDAQVSIDERYLVTVQKSTARRVIAVKLEVLPGADLED